MSNKIITQTLSGLTNKSNFHVRKRITKYLDVNMFARFCGLTRCFVVSGGVVN